VTWFGFANYLSYDFTDKLKGTTRLEFFDDAQGQRTGSRGLYTAATFGLNWQLRKGIILRPEVRYDDNDTSRPFDGRHGLFTAGSDLILRW
ncbi:MAG TPA: outer membrane beta-barrel protein, partial [Gemmataceae bacterium]|nr:outer membrane beta-barrel protein [Gemmataceae bacterium]